MTHFGLNMLEDEYLVSLLRRRNSWVVEQVDFAFAEIQTFLFYLCVQEIRWSGFCWLEVLEVGRWNGHLSLEYLLQAVAQKQVR